MGSGVCHRLFIGFLLTPDFKFQLIKSKQWQDSQITKQDQLQIVAHEKKEYVGVVVEHDRIYLEELKSLEAGLKASLQAYCPSINFEALSATLFPQQYVK